MKAGLRGRIRFVDSLAFRVAVLLSIALLPLGVISVLQNLRIIAAAERLTDAALSGRTAEAAASERALMLTTFGAAEGLVESILALQNDPQACREMLASFVRQSGAVSFAGFTSADGIQRCFSSGRELDLRDSPYFHRMAEMREPSIASSARGPQTDEPVVTIRWPVNSGDSYLGYLVLSIPHRSIEDIRNFGVDHAEPNLVTFNQFGEVLTTDDASFTDVDSRLPAHHDLVDLARDHDQAFRDDSRTGERRIFTAVAVIPGQVYALGSWPPGEAPGYGRIGAAVLFPLLMWLASVGVAYFAVHRLVIRHVREMRGQMRRFALGQRDAPPEVLTGAPAEIQDVSQTFHNLARILIRDEQELEDSVEEKTVLLREVHHRVKNNLQLIASIMNMQIRRVKEPSARAVLKSVQDRVMSLATIHRSLYTAERLSAVPVDELLAEICDQMIVLAGAPGQNIAVSTRFAPITLYPDHAVPLALLATEAVTNAIKYLGEPAEGPPAISVTLTTDGEGQARFTVENSTGRPLAGHAPAGPPGTGLGAQLIQAFVTQLDGRMEAGEGEGGRYRLTVSFPIGIPHPE